MMGQRHDKLNAIAVRTYILIEHSMPGSIEGSLNNTSKPAVAVMNDVSAASLCPSITTVCL